MKPTILLLLICILLLQTHSQVSQNEMKAKYLASLSSQTTQIPWKIPTQFVQKPVIILNNAAFVIKPNPGLLSQPVAPTPSDKQPQQSVPNQQSVDPVRKGVPNNEKVITEPTMINEKGIQDEQTNLKKSIGYMILAFLVCLFVLKHQQNQKEEKIKKYVSISEYAQQFADREQEEESSTRG